MIGNRKKIFSVPRVITIIAAGLSLLRIYDMYWEVGFEGAVAFLVERYDGAIEYLFGWIGKLFNIQIPVFWGHIVVIWLLFSGVNYRTQIKFKAEHGVGKKMSARTQLNFLIFWLLGPISFLFISIFYRKLIKGWWKDFLDGHLLGANSDLERNYIKEKFEEDYGKLHKRSRELPKNYVYELLWVLLASLVWYITNVLAL